MDMPMWGLSALLVSIALVVVGLALWAVFTGMAAHARALEQPASAARTVGLAAGVPSVATGIVGYLLFDRLDGGHGALTLLEGLGVASVVLGVTLGAVGVRGIRSAPPEPPS